MERWGVEVGVGPMEILILRWGILEHSQMTGKSRWRTESMQQALEVVLRQWDQQHR